MNHTLSLPTPSAGGSLDRYIQAVNRFPLLTQDEELSLATRFSRDNGQPDRHRRRIGHTVRLGQRHRPVYLPVDARWRGHLRRERLESGAQ